MRHEKDSSKEGVQGGCAGSECLAFGMEKTYLECLSVSTSLARKLSLGFTQSQSSEKRSKLTTDVACR